MSPHSVRVYMQGRFLPTVSGSVNTEADFIALDWEFKKSLTDQDLEK